MIRTFGIKNRTNGFLIILVIGISFLAVHFYLQDNVNNTEASQKELRLRDSISYLQKEIDASRLRQGQLQHAYDSMLLIEPQVIYKTREKIKFIYGDATPDQLDSIIRTNWKVNTGHR